MQCSLKFSWLLNVTPGILGWRVVSRLVPLTITFGFKLHSLVQVENIDVVDLSLDSERFLPCGTPCFTFLSLDFYVFKF